MRALCKNVPLRRGDSRQVGRLSLLALTLVLGVSAIRVTWELGAQCSGEAKVSIERNGPKGPSLGTDKMSDGSGVPTGPKRLAKSNLALQVRRRRVIERAWLAIKRNARTSKSQTQETK